MRCDEPGCELEYGHETLHLRTVSDGHWEWGDYRDLAGLLASLDTPEPPCPPDCEKCRATAEDPEPDDDPNAWRPRKFA